MPEGLEAEIWRRSLEPLVGRTITHAWADSRVSDADFSDVVTGSEILSFHRKGKVVVIETDRAAIGLHFGMTGRVIVDGAAPIDQLEYASGRDREDWDRLWLDTRPTGAGHPAVRMNDPRRLGKVTLNPDLDVLGVDIFDVDIAAVEQAFARRRLAVKSALLDQHLIAGLGNLCADEVLWWAGVAPERPVNELSGAEVTALVAAMDEQLPLMLEAGGSTMGALSPKVRGESGPCPRDGTPLQRDTVGGRTAVWCPQHQH